ncbi:helix-turn-helix transcriptional regulator [Rhabdothermincola sp.]|uniref:helix-turn-helix transcriptional regulator n=1 Tax=Rhabdothermincola sp. TaxID=2820405 RepID=UPI002FE28C5B
MSVERFTRARDLLLAADRSDAGFDVIAAEIVRAFHLITTFSWCAVLTTDPDTFLPSGGVIEGFPPEACTPFWDNELLDPDFNKFNVLARSTDPVATLADAVDGALERSPRFRDVYAPLGAADELRVVFGSERSCVAIGAFVRAERDGTFTRAELDDVRRLVPIVTAVLRRAVGRFHARASEMAPVVVMLDVDGEVAHMSVGARQVLAELAQEVEPSEVPTSVRAAATRARWARTPTNLVTRVRGRSGEWMRLHVTPMEGDANLVAVTIEPAHPADLVPILLESYALTQRETEIVLALARGLSTKEIGAELCISAHTVRDHLKAIYEKADVSSRGELIASLYSNHIMERFHAAVSVYSPGSE